MSTMISEVYDAFVEAGASQDKARKAAEAVASFETRFNAIEQKLTVFQGDMNLMKWMLGLQFAGVAALVMRAFFH